MNMHKTIKGEASSQDEISIFRSTIGLLLHRESATHRDFSPSDVLNDFSLLAM